MTRRDHESRLARIETVLGVGAGPLSQAELAELRQLEVEEARFLPGDAETIPAEALDEAIQYLTGNLGQAQRLDLLRRRSGYFDREEDQ